MEWIYLGHAMWLVVVGDLRILFDPQLGDTHHGGLFAINPARTIDAAALRADFLVVSHRHPDHFDIPTLARLAELDADTVVLTSDPLVERVAKHVGFRTVAVVGDMHRIELTDATLLTTPSYGQETEWGMMVHSSAGVVWNQIDTVLRDTDDIARTLTQAAAAFDEPRIESGIDFGIVQWQPLLEINHTLAGHIGFPTVAYGELLERVAALSARSIVPGSAGARHVPPYEWLNHTVYPVPQKRFLRDVARRCPTTATFPGRISDSYLVAPERVTHVSRDRDWVEIEADPDPCTFIPFAIPEVVDPNLGGSSVTNLAQTIEPWIAKSLVPALERSFPDMRCPEPLRLVLQVVYPGDRRDVYTFELAEHGATVHRRFDDDYDVLNVIAASALAEVIAGRQHWGTALLGGLIRASRRTYRVSPNGIDRVNVGQIFLYYALPYADATERWVDHQLAELAR